MSLHTEEMEMKMAAEAIRRGELVAFPTETVYGLGANAFDPAAIERIYQRKQRPFASPLIVHVADVRMARTVVTEWPPSAQALAEKFWPGPLTMVLPKSDRIPDIATAGLHTVGIRIPDHPVALALIQAAGVPIAAPSANRFTEISPTSAEHVRQSLGDDLTILDGGPTRVGIESTVIGLHRNPPEILRPGMITQRELEEISGLRFTSEPNRPEIVERLGDESPGQHERHYAPKTQLWLLREGEAHPAGRGKVIALPADPKSFAASLYRELRQADGEGWEWIGIVEPPHGDEWTGIRDRLKRASAQPVKMT